MILKGTGMVLILTATILMAYYYSGKKRYRCDDLCTMARALTLLKNQICYLAMPLPEAMTDIAQKIGGSTGKIFKQAGEMMANRQGLGADEIWRQAILQNKGGIYFSAEDFEMILSFGKTLGYLDASQQQDSILMLLEYLKEQEAALRSECGKQERFYISIGALSGLLIIVALL